MKKGLPMAYLVPDLLGYEVQVRDHCSISAYGVSWRLLSWIGDLMQWRHIVESL